MKKLVLFSIDSSDAKIKAALEEMATTLDSGIEDVFVVNNNKEDIKTLLITKFGVKDLIAIVNHDQPPRISTKDLIAISNIVRKTIIEVSAEIETNRDTFKYNGAIFKECSAIIEAFFKEVDSFGMGFLEKKDLKILKEGLAESTCRNLLITNYGYEVINNLTLYMKKHGKDL